MSLPIAYVEVVAAVVVAAAVAVAAVVRPAATVRAPVSVEYLAQWLVRTSATVAVAVVPELHRPVATVQPDHSVQVQVHPVAVV